MRRTHYLYYIILKFEGLVPSQCAVELCSVFVRSAAKEPVLKGNTCTQDKMYTNFLNESEIKHFVNFVVVNLIYVSKSRH